ncbi:uncharacterized protein LOC115620012 [Scaptodrosophila lebanonensis]|uniref:Uncharacterized protein LOC115620012 n=1 Tax=Drosophila lebanonensis TaxID=7225 RepID=A0A6J2T189_DROLE|nr:uncharacterized protein LOC115620012 [Scaptodrosophila lebanonensis]
MDCEKGDAVVGPPGPPTHKPDTTLNMDIDELMSSSSADETPPGMIVVETCVNDKDKSVLPLKQSHGLQQGKLLPKPANVELHQLSDSGSLLTVTEQASCSTNLHMKPNVKFQPLPTSLHCAHGRRSDAEAMLAAATSSAASPDYGISHATRIDGATQCNTMEYDMAAPTASESMPSIGSLVCRICHNADNPEQLVSPCLCKGSLAYVHIHCLERWISTSRCTTCELCQFQYNTEQTLRYTCLQSLRLWYSRAMSRRALQEDCQMFSLLTLVAFGIIGTLLVGIQYYAMHTQSWGLSKLWTKSWMLFFLFMTITVYFANVYMLIKSQLTPWYRWWQSARDIKLILENRRPFRNPSRMRECPVDTASTTASMFTHHDQLDILLQQTPHQPDRVFFTPTASQTIVTAPQGASEARTVPNSATAAIALALQGPMSSPICGDCKSQRTPTPITVSDEVAGAGAGLGSGPGAVPTSTGSDALSRALHVALHSTSNTQADCKAVVKDDHDKKDQGKPNAKSDK